MVNAIVMVVVQYGVLKTAATMEISVILRPFKYYSNTKRLSGASVFSLFLMTRETKGSRC